MYQLFYKLNRYFNQLQNISRVLWLRIQGANIGTGTSLDKIFLTWPHKVKIADGCIIEKGVYFKHDGPYSIGKSILIEEGTFIGSNCEFNIKERIEVGKNCLIASGSRFIDHDHGLSLNELMKDQACPSAKIKIEDNVWLGANVVVLKGVTIKSGAVVAAGAIVNKDIDTNEIWGGVPARKIRKRI